MPRFYFHIYNDMVVHDEEGLELPDLATARHQAIVGARANSSARVGFGSTTGSRWPMSQGGSS